jgi:hypothetical protein
VDSISLWEDAGCVGGGGQPCQSENAYKLEYEKLREYVYAGKRDQLWNVIPASIQTPSEQQAFIERLKRNLNSRDKWIRYLSGRTLDVPASGADGAE